MTKAVTYRWGLLSEEQRKPFEELAEEDKLRYVRESADLKSGIF